MIMRYAMPLLAAMCLSIATLKATQAQGALGSEIVLSPWYYPVLIVPQPRRYPPPLEPAPPPQAFGVLPSVEPTYWYCSDARAYYPDVTQCAGGWQQVVPRRPPPPPAMEASPREGTRLRPDKDLGTHSQQK
jgi:hypothetical protein